MLSVPVMIFHILVDIYTVIHSAYVNIGTCLMILEMLYVHICTTLPDNIFSYVVECRTISSLVYVYKVKRENMNAKEKKRRREK